jgi:hypothetical protein
METVPDETGHGRWPFPFSILPVIATPEIELSFAGTSIFTIDLALTVFKREYLFHRLLVLLFEYVFLMDLLDGSR